MKIKAINDTSLAYLALFTLLGPCILLVDPPTPFQALCINLLRVQEIKEVIIKKTTPWGNKALENIKKTQVLFSCTLKLLFFLNYISCAHF